MLRSILLLQLSQVLGRGLYLCFSFYYINTALGVEAKGLWATLYAMFSILSACSNLGFEVWLTREVAADTISRARAQSFLIRAKGGLWLVALAAGAVWAYLDDIEPGPALAFGFALVFEGIGLAQQAIFEGKLRAPSIALMSFIKSGGFALLAFLVIPFHPQGLTVFAWIFALALFLRVLYGNRAWSLLPETATHEGRGSWRAFVLMGSFTLVTILYFKIDVVMLNAMLGEEMAGNYDNAYLFVEGMTFVSAAVGTVLYPRLVQAKGAERGQIFDAIFNVVLSLGFCAALGIALFGEPVGRLMIGDLFNGATKPLTVLLFSLPIMFVNGLLNRWLFSENRERFALLTAALVALFNVLGNAWLIPEHGAAGAALMTVLTEGLLLGIWLLKGRGSLRLGLTTLANFVGLGLIFGLSNWAQQRLLVLGTGLICFTAILFWRVRIFNRRHTS